MTDSTQEPNATPQSSLQPRPAFANEPESALWQGGYSPKAMVGTWIFSLVATIGIIVLLSLVPIASSLNVPASYVWNAGFVLIALWWILAGLKYAIRRIGTHYELTTQRFIHTSGILIRTTDRIDVIDIDDVAFSQSIIDRILNIGTIRLTSKDATHPLLILNGIDNASKVSGMIDDTRRKERRKRSLHIDAS